eukprot:704836-Hanusia_phi.AAC.8
MKAHWHQKLRESLVYGSPVHFQNISVVCKEQHLKDLESRKRTTPAAVGRWILQNPLDKHTSCEGRTTLGGKVIQQVESDAQRISQKMQQEALDKVKTALGNLRKVYNIRKDPKEWNYDVESYVETSRSNLVNEGRSNGQDSQAKMLTYRFEILKMLVPCENESKAMRKRIFLAVQEILREHHDELTDEQHELLLRAAVKTQLSDLVDVISNSWPSGPKALARLKVQGSYPRMTAVEYQLGIAPEHLERQRGMEIDQRVGFVPDEWQKTLLNVVDSQNSALVVAPTASGKTFISSYVMERCLRSSDEGVVVFVAPT